MTPLEQANALLKAAEEATAAPWIPSRDFERTWWVHAPEGEDKCPLHNGGRGIVESNTPTDNEENDIKFVALARNTAPSIASALLEKHKALEEAKESRAVDLELLAQFMIQHSFATGHGDSIGALLAEFDWQLRERQTKHEHGNESLLVMLNDLLTLIENVAPDYAEQYAARRARAFLTRQGETA